MFKEKVLLFLALLSECLSRVSFGGYSSALHVRILDSKMLLQWRHLDVVGFSIYVVRNTASFYHACTDI